MRLLPNQFSCLPRVYKILICIMRFFMHYEQVYCMYSTSVVINHVPASRVISWWMGAGYISMSPWHKNVRSPWDRTRRSSHFLMSTVLCILDRILAPTPHTQRPSPGHRGCTFQHHRESSHWVVLGAGSCWVSDGMCGAIKRGSKLPHKRWCYRTHPTHGDGGDSECSRPPTPSELWIIIHRATYWTMVCQWKSEVALMCSVAKSLHLHHFLFGLRTTSGKTLNHIFAQLCAFCDISSQ